MAPSVAMRLDFLSADAMPFFRSHTTASSMSPPLSCSAFLQSIIPAPVLSRISFTCLAVMPPGAAAGAAAAATTGAAAGAVTGAAAGAAASTFAASGAGGAASSFFSSTTGAAAASVTTASSTATTSSTAAGAAATSSTTAAAAAAGAATSSTTAAAAAVSSPSTGMAAAATAAAAAASAFIFSSVSKPGNCAGDTPLVFSANSITPAPASTWIPSIITLRSNFSFIDSFTLLPSTPSTRTLTVAPTVQKSSILML
mmetsp:Transcript_31023/g.77686  ORF Transcript_31023/g.77686 Transcript_31023/m.77686 type:complete len:256 (+) Transcript_31023:68-835(+)